MPLHIRNKLIKFFKVELYSQLLMCVELHHKAKKTFVLFPLPGPLLSSGQDIMHRKVHSTTINVVEETVSNSNPLILLRIIQKWLSSLFSFQDQRVDALYFLLFVPLKNKVIHYTFRSINARNEESKKMLLFLS